MNVEAEQSDDGGMEVRADLRRATLSVAIWFENGVETAPVFESV